MNEAMIEQIEGLETQRRDLEQRVSRMNNFLAIAIADAGEHMGRVIRLMVDGVAFHNEGKMYHVFSHEGDELGTLSTADVSYAINYMKRKGREVGKCSTYTDDPRFKNDPAFTFAWEGWLMFNGRRM
jgi:hypothetical protein